MKTILRLSALLLVFITQAGSTPSVADEARRQVVSIAEDWHISAPLHYENAHLKIAGNVYFEKGGALTLENCTLELLCRFSRQYSYYWRGGTLQTRNVTIGGSEENGVYYQSNFNLHDGQWDAIDTTVRYTYGITFADDTIGKLRATRLIAGPNSDAIIVSGRGDVILKDSRYQVALNIPIIGGNKVTLDLPVGQPVTTILDDSNLPGVHYRLELDHVVIPDFWFVFFQGVAMVGPPCEITLRDCPRILPSLSGHNLAGDLRLPDDFETPFQIGNLRVMQSDKPVAVAAWGVYLSGAQTDLTLRGPALIGELMLWDGKVSVLGTPGTRDVCLLCTTIDLHTDAVLNIQNARLGLPTVEWMRAFPAFQRAPAAVRAEWEKYLRAPPPIIGQITASDHARLVGENLSLGRLLLITNDAGAMSFTNATPTAKLETRGEAVTIRPLPPP